jgi:hypothetical protein
VENLEINLQLFAEKEEEEKDQEEKDKEEKDTNSNNEILQAIKELKECLQPKIVEKQGEQEIPIPKPPAPAIPQEEQMEQPKVENKLKKFLKAIW